MWMQERCRVILIDLDEWTKSYLPWTWYPFILFLPQTCKNDSNPSPYELRCVLDYLKYSLLFNGRINVFWVLWMALPFKLNLNFQLEVSTTLPPFPVVDGIPDFYFMVFQLATDNVSGIEEKWRYWWIPGECFRLHDSNIKFAILRVQRKITDFILERTMVNERRNYPWKFQWYW